jgi:hypothetical protein
VMDQLWRWDMTPEEAIDCGKVRFPPSLPVFPLPSPAHPDFLLYLQRSIFAAGHRDAFSGNTIKCVLLSAFPPGSSRLTRPFLLFSIFHFPKEKGSWDFVRTPAPSPLVASDH